MKQLGNLAIVCARKPGVFMQICNGYVTVHIGSGPSHQKFSAYWEDDPKIQDFIRWLNFGKEPGHEQGV